MVLSRSELVLALEFVPDAGLLAVHPVQELRATLSVVVDHVAEIADVASQLVAAAVEDIANLKVSLGA